MYCYIIAPLFSKLQFIKRTKFGQHFKYWDVPIYVIFFFLSQKMMFQVLAYLSVAIS